MLLTTDNNPLSHLFREKATSITKSRKKAQKTKTRLGLRTLRGVTITAINPDTLNLESGQEF